MIQTILTALAVYIATSVDEIPILFMLYTRQSNRGNAKLITLAYFLGTFVLIGIGLLGSFGLSFIPEQWIIGLFGLVPLVLGIKVLIKGENDDEEEDAENITKKYQSLMLQVLAITIGLGADDLSVYVPLFTTVDGWNILIMILVFAISTALLCRISYKLTSIRQLVEFTEKYERFIIGIIFSVIGILIMYESGTVTHFFTIV